METNESPQRPLRFGIADLIGLSCIYAAQMSVILNLTKRRDYEAMMLCILIVACYTSAAAFLAYRYSTENKDTAFLSRFARVVLMEAGLILITPFAIAFLPLLIFAIPLIMVFGSKKK